MAIKVEANRVVKIAYRITDASGRLLEERTPENAYEYIQGGGQIVAPVERALHGRTAGFSTEVSCTPRDAYGEYDPSLVAEIPRAKFPAGGAVEVGMKFNTLGPGGNNVIVRVIEVDDAVVTVDGNHPLAGLDLIFDVRVLDVREATEHELSEGRVHAASSGRGAVH